MRTNNFLATVLLLLSATITANFAAAAGNSIDDGFDALDKAKGGSKTTGQGIDAGFGSLDKGKGNTAAGQGVDAGFGALDNGKSKGNAATGHSIEAGFQDVAAQRAEKATREAEKKRIRMEEEAKKQDQDMEKDCHCVYNNCDSGLRSYSCVRTPGERRSTCDEQHARQREAMDEQDRIRARERSEKKPICDAWKAAGPTANSASFKAQLRQQDDAIAAAQRAAADAARQRDALIEADIKKNMAQEESAREAERKAAENAVKDAAKTKLAAEKKAREDREAREKAAFRIVNSTWEDYRLTKTTAKTWCQRKLKEVRDSFSTGRNVLISQGNCTCKIVEHIPPLQPWYGCAFPFSYKEYETASR